MWTELKDHLEDARRAVLEEIRNYPSPIAACDLQFNYLLEERDRLSGELSRLAGIRRDATQTCVESLNDFINASACIDDALKARLIVELKGRFGKSRQVCGPSKALCRPS